MKLATVALTAALCGTAAALITREVMPVKRAAVEEVIPMKKATVERDKPETDGAAPVVPLAQAPKPPEAAPAIPSASTVCRQVLNLQYDVEYTVEVNVGTAVTWVTADSPLFVKGDLVRPVSVMGIAVWKDVVISTTHVLLWRKIDSEEGMGSEVSVLGSGFSSEADVPPRSLLSLDVRPRFGAWGKVISVNDIVITAGLELAPTRPLENPTPTIPNPH